MDEIDPTKFRLDEIKKIGIYFQEEFYQINLCCKKLSKYVTAFDYTDKILIVLSATSGGVSIISFMSVVGAPVRMPSAGVTLICFNNWNNKKIIKDKKKQKEKA